MPFTFSGLDPLYKVPKFIGKIVFSAGAVAAGSLPLFVLYVATKTSAGSMVADTDVLEVTSEEEVDTYAGARSLLAQMARAGIQAAPSSRHFIAAVAEPGGGTAATATIVLAGAPTSAGELVVTVAGKTFRTVITTSSTLDGIGADIEAKMLADTRLPVVASYDAPSDTLTLTCANVGAQGRDWIVKVDQSKLPSGLTATLTGSAALSGGRARMGASGSGTGTEDVTNILTKLQTQRFARIAPSSNDATNAALWEAHVNSKADMLKLLLEQVVFGYSGTLANSKTLAATTLNAQRAQVVWMPNADIHPAVIASVKAAIRAATEGTDPVPDYDGLLLPGIPGHLSDTDIPIDADQNSALNSGVTPVTTVNGEARVVRSITSYCKNGSAQDERTLDIGDAVMTDYAMLDLKLLYETDFRVANKYVEPDPRPGEPEPATGTGHPSLWSRKVLERMLEWRANGWVRAPSLDHIQSQYNAVANAIESQITLYVSRVQHQMRQIVRQTAPR